MTTATATKKSAKKTAASGKQPSKAQADKTLIGQLQAALRSGTPLVGITTADQPATVNAITEALNGSRPIISWDAVRGFVSLNGDKGTEAIAEFGGADPFTTTPDMGPAFKLAAEAPKKTVLIVLNAQRHLDDKQGAQAIANLREIYKSQGACVVLMGPYLAPPADLAHDIIVLDEPLPDRAQLEQIIRELHSENDIPLGDDVLARTVEAVTGLSAFEAEQVTAMSLAQDAEGNVAIDESAVWERKRKQIEQTPGLSVNREGFTFDDLGGLPVIKNFLRRVINGNGRPNAIVFLDEFEKMIGGAAGDTSGVSQDQTKALLSYMTDHKAEGVLLVGHPGSGKSAIAKATGNEAGVPTITLDLGAAKGGIVGESEHNIREALKVITSVSSGKTLWIATTNGIQNISPELRRRFGYGIWMFDLPTADERAAIWQVHRAKYGIAADDVQPDDKGWTGAEIEKCCKLAWDIKATLVEASDFIVPVSLSAKDRIEALRQQAEGNYLSASNPGTYRAETDAPPIAVDKPRTRKMSFGE